MEVVYGGCFNPPTIAHQEIISYLANHYDKVILITEDDLNIKLTNNIIVVRV